VTTATSSSVQLSWTAPPSGAPGYIVERKTLTGAFAALPNTPDAGTPGVTIADNTIDPFTAYVYRVRAVSLTDSSAPSNERTVGPPPDGFNVVSPDPTSSGHNDEFGREIQMVLDANGDPAISYLYLLRAPSSSNEGDPPPDDFSPTAIYFVSWNRAQYRWNAPALVAMVDDIRVFAPQTNISLARDPVNNTFGLAYAVGNDLGRLDLSLSIDGGSTWTRQTIADNQGFQLQEVSLALYGGAGHLVYTGFKNLEYITGSQTVPPARWTRTEVPLPPGLAGTPRPAFSLAVDNTGTPGLAFWTSPAKGDNSVLGYWKPGSLNSVAVTDTNNNVNGLIGCDLTFFGTQPRIAMFAVRDTTSSWVWTSMSNDAGVTWTPPANVPRDVRALLGGYISIAAGSKGQGAIVADFAGGSPAGMQCGLPKLARSPDFTTWTTCSPTGAQTPEVTPAFMRIAFAANDLLYLVFQNSNYDLAGVKNGVVLWHEPQQP